MQKWVNSKLIYRVPRGSNWSVNFAQMPIAEIIDSNRVEVYFSTRDASNKSWPMKIAFDAQFKIIEQATRPILNLGPAGSFDENGIMPCSIVDYLGVKWLFYEGWSSSTDYPHHNAIGLAHSHDGGKTFQKNQTNPIVDSSDSEPYIHGTCHVKIDEGIWKMWYMCGTDWVSVDGLMEPRYHLRYAESCDGVHWRRQNDVAIDFKSEEEAGIACACVLLSERFEMWYCYRNLVGYRENPQDSYKIGYATSADGKNWIRLDELIQIEKQPWNSQMQAYPNVFDFNGRRLMLYNGNRFGRDGFGISELSNQC